MLKTISILGVKVTSESEDKILEYVLDRLRDSGKQFFITTPNPEILTYAHSHLDYHNKLNEAEVALPDGIGLLLAARLQGQKFKERITGVDFVEKLCEKSRKKPVYMGFLGGRGNVAEKAANRLRQKYPWIKVAWVGEEWPEGKNDALRASSSELDGRGPVAPHPRSTSSVIMPAGAHRGSPSRATPLIDILFVAYGFPKQEEWIYKNLPNLPVKAAMGVGGAFDYLSGNIVRAPKVVRALGLEWLFRLIRQPWRIRRQLALLKFVWLVLKERVSKR